MHPWMPCPRRLPIWGSILDDVWALAGRGDYGLVDSWLQEYDAVMERAGVRMSTKKSIIASPGEEVQGLQVKSDRELETWFGLSCVKRARVMLSGWAQLGMPRPRVRGLERTVGKAQHAYLPVRHPIAL